MDGEAILAILAAVTLLLSVTIPTFYVKVGHPFMEDMRDLIRALRDNTAATNTSATAMETTAKAVDDNTVVTKAAADASTEVKAAVETQTAAIIAGTGDGRPAAPVP